MENNQSGLHRFKGFISYRPKEKTRSELPWKKNGSRSGSGSGKRSLPSCITNQKTGYDNRHNHRYDNRHDNASIPMGEKEPMVNPKGTMQYTGLSEEQRKVVDLVMEHKSVFFTGPAGTGKSHLLNFLREFVLPWMRKKFFVTALTGMAALPLNGTTLHSFSGMGLATAPKEKLIFKVSRDGRQRWKACDVLFVDEISMCSVEFFEKLDFVARHYRKCPQIPFGGIQLILCGDFLQLPPVNKSCEGKMVFLSPLWKQAITEKVILKKCFRQEDKKFVSILNDLRRGIVSPLAEVELLKCGKRKQEKPEFTTRLYSKRMNVDAENARELNKLNGVKYTYLAHDDGQTQKYGSQLDQRIGKELVLKVGALVMLRKNMMSGGLVNGSTGRVIQFEEEQTKTGVEQYPVIKWDDGSTCKIGREVFSIEIEGQEVAHRTQLPLTLAWAITVHKCQGMTLSYVDVYLGEVFEYGQAYVALSRCRSLEGMRVMGFHRGVIKAHPDAVQFYEYDIPEYAMTKPSRPFPKQQQNWRGSEAASGRLYDGARQTSQHGYEGQEEVSAFTPSSYSGSVPDSKPKRMAPVFMMRMGMSGRKSVPKATASTSSPSSSVPGPSAKRKPIHGMEDYRTIKKERPDSTGVGVATFGNSCSPDTKHQNGGGLYMYSRKTGPADMVHRIRTHTAVPHPPSPPKDIPCLVSDVPLADKNLDPYDHIGLTEEGLLSTIHTHHRTAAAVKKEAVSHPPLSGFLKASDLL